MANSVNSSTPVTRLPLSPSPAARGSLAHTSSASEKSDKKEVIDLAMDTEDTDDKLTVIRVQNQIVEVPKPVMSATFVIPGQKTTLPQTTFRYLDKGKPVDPYCETTHIINPADVVVGCKRDFLSNRMMNSFAIIDNRKIMFHELLFFKDFFQNYIASPENTAIQICHGYSLLYALASNFAKLSKEQLISLKTIENFSALLVFISELVHQKMILKDIKLSHDNIAKSFVDIFEFPPLPSFRLGAEMKTKGEEIKQRAENPELDISTKHLMAKIFFSGSVPELLTKEALIKKVKAPDSIPDKDYLLRKLTEMTPEKWENYLAKMRETPRMKYSEGSVICLNELIVKKQTKPAALVFNSRVLNSLEHKNSLPIHPPPNILGHSNIPLDTTDLLSIGELLSVKERYSNALKPNPDHLTKLIQSLTSDSGDPRLLLIFFKNVLNHILIYEPSKLESHIDNLFKYLFDTSTSSQRFKAVGVTITPNIKARILQILLYDAMCTICDFTHLDNVVSKIVTIYDDLKLDKGLFDKPLYKSWASTIFFTLDTFCRESGSWLRILAKNLYKIDVADLDKYDLAFKIASTRPESNSFIDSLYNQSRFWIRWFDSIMDDPLKPDSTDSLQNVFITKEFVLALFVVLRSCTRGRLFNGNASNIRYLKPLSNAFPSFFMCNINKWLRSLYEGLISKCQLDSSEISRLRCASGPCLQTLEKIFNQHHAQTRLYLTEMQDTVYISFLSYVADFRNDSGLDNILHIIAPVALNKQFFSQHRLLDLPSELEAFLKRNNLLDKDGNFVGSTRTFFVSSVEYKRLYQQYINSLSPRNPDIERLKKGFQKSIYDLTFHKPFLDISKGFFEELETKNIDEIKNLSTIILLVCHFTSLFSNDTLDSIADKDSYIRQLKTLIEIDKILFRIIDRFDKGGIQSDEKNMFLVLRGMIKHSLNAYQVNPGIFKDADISNYLTEVSKKTVPDPYVLWRFSKELIHFKNTDTSLKQYLRDQFFLDLNDKQLEMWLKHFNTNFSILDFKMYQVIFSNYVTRFRHRLDGINLAKDIFNTWFFPPSLKLSSDPTQLGKRPVDQITIGSASSSMVKKTTQSAANGLPDSVTRALGVNIDDILTEIRKLNPPNEVYRQRKNNLYTDNSVKLSSGRTITKAILDNLVQRFCSANTNYLILVNFTQFACYLKTITKNLFEEEDFADSKVRSILQHFYKRKSSIKEIYSDLISPSSKQTQEASSMEKSESKKPKLD